MIFYGLSSLLTLTTLPLDASFLLGAVLNELDEFIWNKVYDAVIESNLPFRPASSIQQALWLYSTSSFANSTEHRKYVGDVLKEELGHIYVRVPGCFEAFFGEVAGFKPAAQARSKSTRKGIIRSTEKGAAGRAGPKERGKGMPYAGSHG